MSFSRPLLSGQKHSQMHLDDMAIVRSLVLTERSCKTPVERHGVEETAEAQPAQRTSVQD